MTNNTPAEKASLFQNLPQHQRERCENIFGCVQEILQNAELELGGERRIYELSVLFAIIVPLANQKGPAEAVTFLREIARDLEANIVDPLKRPPMGHA